MIAATSRARPPYSRRVSCTIRLGRYSSDDAKITGMTPAWLTFNGRYVDEPPYIFRPTMRLAYCTGIRRWPCSTKTTPAMIASARHADEREDQATAAVEDGLALGRDARGDTGEDQQRHTVADAALGDELAEPHDNARRRRS